MPATPISADFEEVELPGSLLNDEFEEVNAPIETNTDDFEEAKEFLPLEELTKQVDRGEFDPLRYSASLQASGVDFSSLPLEQQKRLRDAYVHSRQRGVTAEGVKRGVKGIPGAVLEFGKGLLQTGRTTGAGAKALLTGEQDEAVKKFAEVGAATEAAGLETVDFARRAGRKILRGPQFPAVSAVDPSKREVLEKDFNFDLGVATQIAKAERGQGAFAELRELDAESLRKEGIELDEEAIRSMSLALDPLNFVPAAGGFQLVTKSGKVVAFAKTMDQLQRVSEKIAKISGKSAGAVTAGTGKLTGGAGKLTEAATRVATPGVLPATIGAAVVSGSVAPLLGVAVPVVVRGGAELLQKTGQAITRAAPVVEKVTEFVTKNAVLPAASGALVGGVASLPLAALTDSDAEAEGIISFGGAGGALLGPLHRAASRVGDPIATVSKALEDNYRNVSREQVTSLPYGDTPLDATHAAQMESLAKEDPTGANLISAVRETLRPSGKRLFVVGDEAFTSITGSPSAQGWITPDRSAIYLRRRAGSSAALHEGGHAIQALMRDADPALHKSWTDLIRQVFPQEKIDRFKQTYEDLINKDLPQDGKISLSPEEVLEEVGAEAISNALRGHPMNGLPIPFRQRAIGIAGALAEHVGLRSPDLVQPGTEGASSLGVQQSFRLSNAVNDFMGRNGLSGLAQPPVIPGQQAPPPSPAPVPRKEAASLKKAAPVADFEPTDANGWNSAEQQLVESGAPETELQTFRRLRSVASKPQGEVGPVEVQYDSVTPEGTRPIERIFRRQQQANAYELEAQHLLGLLDELPPDLRTTFSKTFIPNRVVLRKRTDGSLNVNVLGTSPDKILANAILAGRVAKSRGIALPVDVDKNGLLTAAGAERLHDALVKYTQNQANGYAGDGSRLTRPQGYEAQLPPENPSYTPQALDLRMAQFINLLVGIEPPRTSRAGSTPRFSKSGQKITTPANLEAQALAQANIVRARTEGRASMADIRPSRLSTPGKNVFKTGETVAEFNPLRDEFSQRGVELDKILSEGVEELSIEHFRGVSDVQSALRGVSTPVVTAGFMPETERQWRVSGQRRGASTEITVTAPTETEARRRAEAQGVRPTKVISQSREAELMGMFMPDPVGFVRQVDASQNVGDIFKSHPGSLTGAAIEVGMSVKPEDLSTLQELQGKWNAEAKRLIQAKQLSEALPAVAKGQFYREAYEAATGTGGIGEFLQRREAPQPAPQVQDVVAPLVEAVNALKEAITDGGIRSRSSADISDVNARGTFLPALAESESKTILDAIREGVREGVTLNRDGTEFQPGNRKLDVVTVASVDVPVDELSPERIQEALRPYAEISKGWILPNGDWAALGGQWHHEYLKENAEELNTRFKTNIGGEPNERLDAVNKGFVRVNYEKNGGTLTLEANKKFWTKNIRDAAFELYLDNADEIDNMRVNLMDDEGKLVKDGYSRLFTYPEGERIDRLPLITEGGGAFMPETNKRVFIGGLDADGEVVGKVAGPRDAHVESGLRRDKNWRAVENGPVVWWERSNATEREIVNAFLERKGFKTNGTHTVMPRASDTYAFQEMWDLIHPKEDPGAFMPAQAELDAKKFPEAYPLKERPNLSTKKKAELKDRTVSVPYNFKTTALAKKVMGKDFGTNTEAAKAKLPKLVEAYAEKIESVFDENKTNPEIAAALTWYSDTRGELAKKFSDERDYDLISQLLAATSRQTDVKQNFNYAVELFNRYQEGEFDAMIPKFLEIWNSKVLTGDYMKDYEAAHGRTASDSAMLEWAIEDQGGVKLRSMSGKRYGLHTVAALQVISGIWLQENAGAKVINFYKNLRGLGNRSTIDIWASRFLNRVGNEGLVKRWRIRPAAEAALNNTKIEFAQEIFDAAATRLNIEPDALQAFLWFLEKDVWEKRGWDESSTGKGSEKTSFGKELSKVDIRRVDSKPLVVDIKSGKRFDTALREAKIKPKARTSELPLYE